MKLRYINIKQRQRTHVLAPLRRNSQSNNTKVSIYSRIFKCVGSGNSLDENERANKGIIIIIMYIW